MIPYLDAGFVISLLIQTAETEKANKTLNAFSGPFPLTFLHQLQAENFLLRKIRSKEGPERLAGQGARKLWNYYFAEGVFRLEAVNWVNAFTLAITWTEHFKAAPPPPLLLLHPAMAVDLSVTHFLSFDPRARLVAKAAGLKVLPDTI
jgi:hypothetical protein